MRDAYVIGAGMTAFGKFLERGLRSFAEEATEAALKDAAVAPEDVQAAYFSNATAGLITGQEMIRGQIFLRRTGLLGTPIFNVENACASGATAFHLATLAVRSGQCELALAVGAEKLTHTDKARSFSAIGTAVDVEQVKELMADLARREKGDGSDTGGGKRSMFMDVYAKGAQAYMERTGATELDFARVSAKNHGHGALNPKAQYGEKMTADEVLASREVAWPLTLLMCSPIGDGAAALVVCSERVARKLDADPIRIRATALVSGRDREPDEPGSIERAAQQAYEEAGLEPGDLDLVEVHDAAAPAELMAYEELGLCERGGGPKLLASGDTELGGRLPVNTSGGLESKGHPIGASGCAQLVELVDQLRGRCGGRQVDGAHVGLAQNGGGFLSNDAAAMAVTVLSH